MSERVFPASKPPAAAAAAPTKAQPYNPAARPAYRQPINRRHYNRPRRNYCCCCCFWAILILLVLASIAAVSGIVVYMLYRPHRPTFIVGSLRLHRLNVTTNVDSAASHISSLFNLTVSSKNPNSRISFSYDPFQISVFSSPSGVFIGNGSLPAFVSGGKNETTFRAVVLTASEDLDSEDSKGVRSDLKKRSGSVEVKFVMDTRVEVKMEKLRSKKVGIRVSCDGIKGVIPRGKSPAVANVAGAKCVVDLRIKIWNWTF